MIFPMTFRTKTLHVGDSSFVVQDVLTDTEAGDVLMTTRRQFVAADVSSGHSAELPVRLRSVYDLHLPNVKALFLLFQ